MRDAPRRPTAMRRLLAYALVPLSAVPFVLITPMVAPSVEQRVEHLRERPAPPVRAPVGGAPTSTRPQVGERPRPRPMRPAERGD